MNNAREPATWQQYLGRLIENPHERQRLATAIRMRPITLQRWADGISRPRDENINALLKAWPAGSYPLFMRLLITDFPHLAREDLPPDRFPQEVPAEFYARALSALAFTPQPMCRQVIMDLVLQQALEHLDPDRRGLSISLVLCVPPRGGRKVHSLREIGGLGTPPWPHNLTEKTVFFGSESLVGYAVSNLTQCVINSRDEVTVFPAQWTEHERSAAAFPLARHARVSGGMVVSSTLEHFFTKTRIAVLERYSYLVSLICETEEFFDLHDIDLRMMPSVELQAPYFAGYNQRLSQKFAEARDRRAQISLQEARQLVWQDLEEVLLRVFLQTEVTSDTTER